MQSNKSIWKWIVVAVLALTAIPKLVAFLWPGRLLYENDGVLGLPLLWVVGGAGLVEAGLCIFVARSRGLSRPAWGVCLFAVVILTYRTIAHQQGVAHCPCLGNVIVWWPWLGRHENPILITLAFWLFLTS